MDILLFLSIIFTILFILYIIFEVFVNDWPPKDSYVIRAISTNIDKGFHIDRFNNKKFNIGKMPPILKISGIPMPYGYEIKDVGPIPFWYKSYRLLRKIDKKLASEREDEILKKLGI